MTIYKSPNIPDPDDVVADALLALEISLEHSEACQKETRYWLENDGLDDPQLNDLTHLPFVTIDNPDSRDLDQALLIEHDVHGYRVRYALADASYYIRPGSALFAEALARGTTYYTPLLAAPMLPVELSEGLISLNPSVPRRAVVFDMLLTEDAIVRRCTIVRGRISSQAKLDYAGVQAWLDSGKSNTRPYHPSLRLLAELGEKLIIASAQRGVVQFDRTEAELQVAGSPPHFVPSLRTRFNTERYNEQISLICNMQGAQMLLGLAGVSNVLQAIFRVHEAPLQKSLRKLKETINAFADHYPQQDQWRWSDGQSLAEYVDQLPSEPIYKRRVRAIQRQIMQAQRASLFQPEPGEHHALKACSYARFSSPMREVVGIFTHKELLEALGGSSYNNEHDSALREQIIESANAAKRRQRQLDKSVEFAALFSVFSKELARESGVLHSGTIIGLRSDRLYINLDNLALDVKIYRDDLQSTFATRYKFSDSVATPEDLTKPSWRLGQGVSISTKAYDKSRKRFIFSITPND